MGIGELSLSPTLPQSPQGGAHFLLPEGAASSREQYGVPGFGGSCLFHIFLPALPCTQLFIYMIMIQSPQCARDHSLSGELVLNTAGSLLWPSWAWSLGGIR